LYGISPVHTRTLWVRILYFYVFTLQAHQNHTAAQFDLRREETVAETSQRLMGALVIRWYPFVSNRWSVINAVGLNRRCW
jgi:hypothetical protein